MNPYASMRIHEIRNLIKKKEVSPVEVFRAYRRQAEKVNPNLNAIIASRWDEAFLEVKDLEKKISAGSAVPPLCGLPFTAKELFEAKDMPHTLGNIRRKNVKGNVNAWLISEMIRQGGTFVGLTNVPEMGFWFETYNLVYGKTSNPYDLRRTSGGSSGGEAAIVSAMGSAFGLGSDIGGSIRIPAAFCGIFGYKPTRFTIPFSGHFPMISGKEEQLSGSATRVTVLGPLCRFADDMIELLGLMAQPDGKDRDVKAAKQFQFKNLKWNNRKVFILKDPHIRWTFPADKSVQLAVEKCAHFFEEQGAIVEYLDNQLFNDGLEIWNDACSMVQGPTFNESLGYEETTNLGQSLFNLLRGKAEMTLPILIAASAEKHLKKLLKPGRMHHTLEKIKNFLDVALGKDNILIMPPHPRTAFLHNSGVLRPFDFIYTGIWNAIDFPVAQVPVGFDRQNLPLGVQVIANNSCDELTLVAAKDLEKAFGGWRPPLI